MKSKRQKLMGAEREIAREAIARATAKTSPEAAVARVNWHTERWIEDLSTRRTFYSQHIEAARERLISEQHEHLRAVWDGLGKYQEAQTDSEREAIDEWLKPLIEAPTVESVPNWMSVLMEPYFEGAVDAEIDELVRVPRYWDVSREWVRVSDEVK
jgi:hypothetical protein